MKLKVTPFKIGVLSRMIALLAITCALFAQAMGQTAANTTIQNQASASYSDGSGGSYSSVSNTVTVTVAKVAGMTITPDASTDPTVVPGQTGILYNFRVTNTGNFSDQVRFLTGGASAWLAGTAPASITRAVIDVDNSGTINAGDTDIKTNAADVLSASIAQNGFINVLVEVSVGGAATAGQTPSRAARLSITRTLTILQLRRLMKSARSPLAQSTACANRAATATPSLTTTRNSLSL
jgi:hypothetical protein